MPHKQKAKDFFIKSSRSCYTEPFISLLCGVALDIIRCDLPYGVTQNHWDCPVDEKRLWEQYRRIINIDDALIEGLSQNQDFFTLLLQNEEIKKEVLGIFADEIYKSLRKEG